MSVVSRSVSRRPTAAELSSQKNSPHTPLSIDDPGIWGVLPLRYTFNPSNLRWTLGAHDICFKNRYISPLSASNASHD